MPLAIVTIYAELQFNTLQCILCLLLCLACLVKTELSPASHASNPLSTMQNHFVSARGLNICREVWTILGVQPTVIKVKLRNHIRPIKGHWQSPFCKNRNTIIWSLHGIKIWW